MSQSLLTTLQLACAARLAGTPFFAGSPPAQPAIPVLTENRGDIVAAIERTVAGLGIYAILLTPTARVSKPDIPGPFFDELRVVVRVTERVITNRSAAGTGQPAALVAEAAAAALHQWRPPGAGAVLRCAELTLVDHESLLTYDVVLLTEAGLDRAHPPERIVPATPGGGGSSPPTP